MSGAAPVDCLLLDTDPFERELVRRFFLAAGRRVAVAPSSDAAQRALLQAQPKVLLIAVPPSSAELLQVLRWARSNASTRNLPVAVLVGAGEAERAVEAYDAEADIVVFRPVDLTVLMRSVEAAARRSLSGAEVGEGGERVATA